MKPEQIRVGIHGFFAETVMYRRARPLSNAESLIKSGLLDSLAMLSLISFLEHTFDITIADEEVEPDSFDSVDTLTAFVGRKIEEAQNRAA
jgi:acyl carrier protein